MYQVFYSYNIIRFFFGGGCGFSKTIPTDYSWKFYFWMLSISIKQQCNLERSNQRVYLCSRIVFHFSYLFMNLVAVICCLYSITYNSREWSFKYIYLQIHISGVSVGSVQFCNGFAISNPYKFFKTRFITGPHVCLAREVCCFSEADGNVLYRCEGWLNRNTS